MRNVGGFRVCRINQEGKNGKRNGGTPIFSPHIEDLFVGYRGVVPMLTFFGQQRNNVPLLPTLLLQCTAKKARRAAPSWMFND